MNGRAQISIGFDEPRHIAAGEPQQVVRHQHLAIAAGPGTDADRRHLHFRRDALGEFGGNALQHNRKRASRFGGQRIGHEPLGVALHFVAAQHMYALRTQAAMGHDGNAGRHEG